MESEGGSPLPHRTVSLPSSSQHPKGCAEMGFVGPDLVIKWWGAAGSAEGSGRQLSPGLSFVPSLAVCVLPGVL